MATNRFNLPYDPATVTRCFLANIFLRARTLPIFVGYWHTQMLPVQVGTVYTDTQASVSDTAASFRRAVAIVTGTLYDVALTGQDKALPLATDNEARPFVLVHLRFATTAFLDAELVVDDVLLSQSSFWSPSRGEAPEDHLDCAGPIHALVALATMTAHPDVHWQDVGFGHGREFRGVRLQLFALL